MKPPVAQSALLELAEKARKQYEAHLGKKWLVSPAAPVLFFGSLVGYEASCLRIATVGLNPSHHEFPSPPEDPFMRFPNADSDDVAVYLSALSSYFRNCPYRSWFGSYEEVLQGMGTTYYGEEENTALHTDIGSVLPTDPTWSRLGDQVRKQLTQKGASLWHDLIRCLQPDILLSSIAWRWMNDDMIELEPLGSWEVIYTIRKKKDGRPRKQPLVIKARWHELSTGNKTLIAHGRATQTPLGSLSNGQKRQVGCRILTYWQDTM